MTKATDHLSYELVSLIITEAVIYVQMLLSCPVQISQADLADLYAKVDVRKKKNRNNLTKQENVQSNPNR